MALFIDVQTENQENYLATSDGMDQDAKKIGQCTVLGGAGYPIVGGDRIEIRFGATEIEIVRNQDTSILIPYVEVSELSISGPGSTTTGGGFVGGGFGAGGALGIVFKTPCSPRWSEGARRGTMAS
jgi:hypothetical protein